MTSPAAGRTSTSTSEAVDAVRSVALDYIEGWYVGDAERMERSLHDDLVKRTPLRGGGSSAADLRSVSKPRMVELTLTGGGSSVSDPAIDVFVDGVSEDIACARIHCADYVDYVHLVKTPSGWKIANILFRSLG